MKHLIKKLLREGLESNGEVIQQYVDIIDTMDKSNSRREKYIQTLKDKYDYDYIETSDEEYIRNPSLTDFKSKNDFVSLDNWKKYLLNLNIVNTFCLIIHKVYSLS